MKTSIPLYMTVYEEIKTRITDKVLPPGTKISSVRSYAVKRGISTTTVERAYNQLVVEGYVTSKPKSGFVVNDIHSMDTHNQVIVEPIIKREYRNNSLTTDLFDMKSYKSIMNKVMNYYSDDLYKPCDPQGELKLRKEIQKYVQSERNISCDVNQIIIGPGIQNLLNILLYINNMKSVSFLEPEFQKAIDIFRYNNYRIHSKSSIEDVLKSKNDYLYISPSNTYPTGDVILVNDRYRLIEWAEKNNSYIIEDDYNFFIRYNSYAIPSIMSLDDNKHVIYMGSFSKTILPSIRISYMILPIPLYNQYKSIYSTISQGVSKLEQLSLALYMKEGLFKRHSKKLYSLYKEKNEIITSILNEKDIPYRGTDSNLHVILDLDKESTDYFIEQCNILELKYERFNDSIIFPYSGLSKEEIPDIMNKLLKRTE